jgi:hypothetical protein
VILRIDAQDLVDQLATRAIEAIRDEVRVERHGAAV